MQSMSCAPTGFAFATQGETEPVFVLQHLIEEPVCDMALSLENPTPLKHDREVPDELSPWSEPAFTAWFSADRARSHWRSASCLRR